MKKVLLLTVALIVTSLWTAAPVAATTTTTYIAASTAECNRIPASAKTSTAAKAQGCRYRITYGDALVGNVVAGYQNATHWHEIRGPFGIWSQKDSYGYRYNGARIYVNWMTCSKAGALYAVTINWCGAYGNGGDAIDFGSNWTVTFIAQGFPVYLDYWQRKWTYANGNHGKLRWGHD